MGRRSDHRPEVLHAMALAAARRVLAEEGLSGLTVRRVAQEIGYSPGTLYNHFANLDDLVLQANAETLDHLLQRLRGLQNREAEPEQVLREMARAYITETRTAPRLWSAVFEHRMAKGSELPDWFPGHIARLFEPVEAAITPLFGPGCEADCRRAARVLWSALHGITSLVLSQKLDLATGLSAEDLADDLVTNYLAGLNRKLTNG